jgi:hypothetical protein
VRFLHAGVDDVDSYEALCRFIDEVSQKSGVSHFIIHARKCILKGLSPADNRTIPPLRWVCLTWTTLQSKQISRFFVWMSFRGHSRPSPNLCSAKTAYFYGNRSI